VFVLFLALNACGYDLEGDPEMHPARVALREAARLAATPGEASWFAVMRPAWPRVALAEAYALHQRGWPGSPREGVEPRDARFGPGDSSAFVAWLAGQEPELPCAVPADLVAALPRLGPVLDGFAARAGALGLWRRCLPDHDAPPAARSMAAAVQDLLRKAAEITGAANWPFSDVRVVPNLLQSRWLADQVLIDNTLWTVVASPDPGLAGSVVHEAVHMAIRPALRPLLPQLAGIATCWPAATAAVRDRLEPIGYWGPEDAAGLYRAVQEYVVRAVVILAESGRDSDARLMGAAAPHVKQGFHVMPWLVRHLAGTGGEALREGRWTELVESILLTAGSRDPPVA
jgi:hypothetical protein